MKRLTVGIYALLHYVLHLCTLNRSKLAGAASSTSIENIRNGGKNEKQNTEKVSFFLGFFFLSKKKGPGLIHYTQETQKHGCVASQ